MSLMFSGIGVSRGIAIGDVYLLRRNQPKFSERKLKQNQISTEVRRYRKALAKAKAQLEKVRDSIPKDTSDDVSAFIETHLLMLDDTVLSQTPIDILKKNKVGAETALEEQNAEKNQISHDWKGKVVVADDLTPADTIVMQHDGVLGFVTETGGQLSHTAILARSLGLPAIVGIHNIRTYLKPGEKIILNGETGLALAEPSESMIVTFQKEQRKFKESRRELNKLINTPAVCADGTSVTLLANIEIEDDLKALKKVSVDGVGLYRTEFLYMNRDNLPDENEHFRVYSKVARALKGSPLTIRTADLGADKEVDLTPSGPLAHNPAMGLRGIRLALSDTSLLIPQLAAILRVSARAPVSIMFPMLTNVHEVELCLELLEDVKKQLKRRRVNFNNDIKVGGMIEVPAAAIAAEQFAAKLDFLSIGTNDLIQYTLAIDRIDDQVNYLYDPLHPAVLQLIKQTIEAGKRADIPVAMCGEMAGDTRYVRLLLGLGLTEFSMPPNSLLEVKRALLGADRKRLQRHAQAMIKCSTIARQ